MAITLQALQADGTWATRNAFVTENKLVKTGQMTIANLEAQARRLMAQWQTFQDGRQLRVYNSDKEPKVTPAPHKTADDSKTYGAWKITEDEFRVALNLSEGHGPRADAAYQLVRYCRGEIFIRDAAAEAARMIRGVSVPA